MTMARRTIDRDEERAWRALELTSGALSRLDPDDHSPRTERKRCAMLAARDFWRDRLDIADDADESRRHTDRCCARADMRLDEARAAMGLPETGPVDWAAVRESLGLRVANGWDLDD